jgi:hypothetical protein
MSVFLNRYDAEHKKIFFLRFSKYSVDMYRQIFYEVQCAPTNLKRLRTTDPLSFAYAGFSSIKVRGPREGGKMGGVYYQKKSTNNSNPKKEQFFFIWTLEEFCK